MDGEWLVKKEETYLREKFEDLKKIYKSQAPLWKEFLKQSYIFEGKDGYFLSHYLITFGLYNIDGPYYVNCNTGEICQHVSHTLDLNLKVNSDFDSMFELLTKPVGEIVFDVEALISNIKDNINRIQHTQDDNYVKPLDWVFGAIKLGIDLTYEDYCAHYSGDERFEISKNEFENIKDEAIKMVAKQALAR